jgi:hypothetical protein
MPFASYCTGRFIRETAFASYCATFSAKKGREMKCNRRYFKKKYLVQLKKNALRLAR